MPDRKTSPAHGVPAVLFLVGMMLSGCVPGAAEPVFSPAPSSYPSTVTPTAILRESLPPASTPGPGMTRTATLQPTPTETVFSPRYVFPVQPRRQIGFAEGTSAHGYPATDIFAPAGWQFVAVTDGAVDFVSRADTWDPSIDDPATRGGLSVAILGEDGLRYYGSHLSKIAEGIAPGVRVTAGEVLGYIGETGDARGRGTHLHFGISRPTYPEDWKARRGEIDPFPYLVAWEQGINLRPYYSTPTPKATP